MYRMFNSITKLKTLDKFTEYRLQNAFIISICLSLIGPILITLKGTLMLAWVISLFGIANTLAVKTNDYFVNSFTISELYKLGVIINILILIGTSFYFINPEIMIWIDSVLMIFELMIFSAYSIILNNYITDNFPDSMKDFQIIRNNIWADGALLGLGLTTLITFFFNIEIVVILFLVLMFLFSLWMIYNWKFYD